MLSCVHTAYLWAVRLALAVIASWTNTLYEYDLVRMSLVGRTKKCTAVRSCGIHKSFKFKWCNYIGTLIVCEFVILIKLYRIETCCYYDSTVLLLNELILLLVIDSSYRAYLWADSALACLKHHAVVRIDSRYLWYSLSERDVDSCSVIKSHIELVWDFFHRTFLGTESAACTLCLVNETSFFLYCNGEITYEALYVRNFAEWVDMYLLILWTFNHFRCKDTSGTVKCREGLIDLSHFTADRRLLLYDINIEACLRYIKCSLYTSYTSADNKCSLYHRTLTCCERCVEVYLRNSSLTKNYCLLCSCCYLFVYPWALLTYICYLNKIRVETYWSSSLTECILVHTRWTWTYNDSCKIMLFYCVLDKVLSWFGTHILVILRDNYSRFMTKSLCNSFNVHGCGDISTAMTDKYSYSLHRISSLLCIFPECSN